MATLVDIDFEAGDLSEFSDGTSGGASLSAIAGAALAGTAVGMACVIDSTTGRYGKHIITPSATGVFRARFYFDPNGVVIPASSTILLLNLYEAITYTPQIAAMRLRRNGTNTEYQFHASIKNDAGADTYTSNYTVTDEPHYAEIEVVRASSAVASDATLKLYVDNVLLETVAGIDLYDGFDQLGSMRFGIQGISASTSGTVYLDQLVVTDDTAVIGPYVPPASGGGADARSRWPFYVVT